MSNSQWEAYFDLLELIAETLTDLGQVQERKIHAVQKGDLPTIDEIMKQEQAFAMTLRGFEQKRVQALEALAVPKGPLKDLMKSVPAPLEEEALDVVEYLQEEYARYQQVADLARQTLEHHLSQLEGITGQDSGYSRPKPKQERSLEDPLTGPVQQPGNVQLNLRSLHQAANPEVEAKVLPKVVPVSQETLIAVAQAQELVDKAEQEALLAGNPVGNPGGEPSRSVGVGSMTTDLRQFAQREAQKNAEQGAKHRLTETQQEFGLQDKKGKNYRG